MSDLFIFLLRDWRPSILANFLQRYYRKICDYLYISRRAYIQEDQQSHSGDVSVHSDRKMNEELMSICRYSAIKSVSVFDDDMNITSTPRTDGGLPSMSNMDSERLLTLLLDKMKKLETGTNRIIKRHIKASLYGSFYAFWLKLNRVLLSTKRL